MKTYSEEQGAKPFNWFEVLNSENPNWYVLKKKADSWVTCACGNQCDIIPIKNGIPIDFKLFSLGLDFSLAVYIMSKNDSLEILLAIEQRTAQLIKELTK